MRVTRRTIGGGTLATLATLAMPAITRAQTAKISFYYPIQVGGALTKVIDGYVANFKAANPGIDVEAVYAGNYLDTTTKSLTAAKSGKPPSVAVLLATDIYTFLDEG